MDLIEHNSSEKASFRAVMVHVQCKLHNDANQFESRVTMF